MSAQPETPTVSLFRSPAAASTPKATSANGPAPSNPGGNSKSRSGKAGNRDNRPGPRPGSADPQRVQAAKTAQPEARSNRPVLNKPTNRQVGDERESAAAFVDTMTTDVQGQLAFVVLSLLKGNDAIVAFLVYREEGKPVPEVLRNGLIQWFVRVRRELNIGVRRAEDDRLINSSE